MREVEQYELMRKVEMFNQLVNSFTPTLMELHTYGFKGYLIKKDGTIETILHGVFQKEVDAIHEYIESKRLEIFSDKQTG